MPANTQESLQLLLDVCLLLSSKLEISGLLMSIMELSSRVVGAETASLLLLDEKTDELYFHVALGLDDKVSQIRLKMGQGIAGTVAKEQKSVIINDVRSDPRWTSKVDTQSGFQTRSILASPMLIKGKLLGVVEAINHIDGPFNPEDIKIFEAFASQAAIAIDNARLFSSLREEKAKLDTIFTQMNDAAVMTQSDGTILLSNDAANKFFSVAAGAPKTINEELSLVKVTPPLAEILASKARNVEFEVVRDQPKKLILSGTASIIELDGPAGTQNKGRLFVFRDVTEQRQEELLKRSFLSLISHKLKTPLASITGYTQLILDDFAKNGASESNQRSLQTVYAQGKKLSGLVDKLLRFVTLQQVDSSAPTVRAVCLDDVLGDAAKAIQSWAQEQNGLVIINPGCGEKVYGDPQMLRDAAKDLIENGIKFNTKPEKKVTCWTEAKEGSVIVHVQDQGPGIPPEEQEKIFSKFHQVESSFTGQVDGWGLGLAFVKQVVNYHGGKVWLQSRLDEGTTVSFSIPAARN